MEIQHVGREQTLSISCMLLSCFREWSETTKECTEFASLYRLFCSYGEKKVIFDPILVPRSDQERSITSPPPGQQWSYLYYDNICGTQLKLDPTSAGTGFHCVVAAAKFVLQIDKTKGVRGSGLVMTLLSSLSMQNTAWNKALLSFVRCPASETPEPSAPCIRSCTSK